MENIKIATHVPMANAISVIGLLRSKELRVCPGGEEI
jgi:hypothetical protein